MEKPAIMLRIDDALNKLAKQDVEESAAVLAIPVNILRRELRVAQAWLQRELDQGSHQ